MNHLKWSVLKLTMTRIHSINKYLKWQFKYSDLIVISLCQQYIKKLKSLWWTKTRNCASKKKQGIEYFFILCNLPTYSESLISLVCETIIVELKFEDTKITPFTKIFIFIILWFFLRILRFYQIFLSDISYICYLSHERIF
jgi:hypothetical protein